MSTVQHVDALDLRVDNRVFPVTPFVRRFVWCESLLQGGYSWQVWFKSAAWADWNDLLLGRDKSSFQFRLSTSEGVGEDISTEWRTSLPDSSRAMFKGQTLLGYVEGGDKRLDLMQEHRVRSWDNLYVSDVVNILAREHGLTPVVETSSHQHTQLLQIHETDWEFLRRVVYEEASQSGRGDFYLWMDEDELHLGAPQLQRSSDRRHDMDVVENRVERILLTYAGRGIDRLGGATLNGIGFDFDAKVGITFSMDLQASSTQPSLAGKVPRAQSGGLRLHPVSEDDSQGVEANTRGRWGRLAPRYFGLRVDSRPDISLRPGRILELQATLGEDQETPFLGRFVVLEVQHEMVGGAISTTAVCYRREAFAWDEAPSGSRAENVRTTDPYRLGEPTRQRVVKVAEVL